MKQRLLLSLLMLFVSVGFIKGQTAVGDGTLILNIQKGASVTVTATGGPLFITDNSIADYTTTPIKIDGSKETADFSKTIKIGTGVKTLEVSGKVIHANLDDPQVETLTFTSNGELLTVDVSKATALKTLKAGDNKIYNIAWPSQEVAFSGNQTIDASAVSGTADGFNVLEAVKTNSISLIGLGKDYNVSDITISGWKAEEGTINATEYADNHFVFTDGEGYYTSGKVSCKLTNGDASVTLTGIEITPAEVTIKTLGSDKNLWGDNTGSMSFTTQCSIQGKDHNTNPAVCHQGDKITVKDSPATGYEIDKFEVKGLVQSGEKNQFVVKAKPGSGTNVQEEVSIKAVFKGKPQTVTLSPLPENGGDYTAYELVQKEAGSTEAERGQLLTAGKTYQIAYGNGIELNANPSDLYKAVYQINNGAEEEFEKGTAKIEVDGNKAITVVFKPNSMDSKYSFELAGAEDASENWSTILSVIKVGSSSIQNLSTTKISDEVQLDNPSDVIAGQTTNMSLTVDDEYIISSIILNGTQNLQPQPTATANVYNVAFTAPEDGNAAFIINVKKLQAITILVNNKQVSNGQVDAQEYTYDGKAKAFAYSTKPGGLTLDLKYAAIGTDGNPTSYSSEAPVNAGSYAVQFSREADKSYAALGPYNFQLSGGSKAVLVINPAAVQIKTPEVKAVEQEDGTYKYSISSAEGTALGNTVKGVFDIIAVNGYEGSNKVDITDLDAVANAKAIAKDNFKVWETKSHSVTLRFKVQKDGKDDPNFQVAAVVVPVKIGDDDAPMQKITINPKDVRIDGTSVSNIPVTVTVFNGTQELKSGSSEFNVEVPAGTTLNVQIAVNGYKTVKLVEATDAVLPINAILNGTVFECTISKAGTYGIELDGKLKDNVYKVEFTEPTYSTTYTGSPILYDLDNLTITKEGTPVTGTTKAELCASIYYTDKAGNRLSGAPINAGDYVAHLDIPIDMTAGLSGASFEMPMQITQKTPKVTWPTSVDLIGKGMTLEAANLRGYSAEVEGICSFVDKHITPKDGEHYRIQFVPNDTQNYTNAYLEADEQSEDLAIQVTDKPIMVIANVANGVLSVDNYTTGTQIPAGTKLTIHATPNPGFEVETITIDMNGHRYEYPGSSSVVFEMPDESILVTGSFRVKVAPGNFRVVIPEDGVRGAIISGGGQYVVAADGSVSFTVSTLAADANKVSVTASNGTVTKGSNGRYTVSNIQANTTVRVSLSNPTALKVDIKESYLNDKKYHVGSVEIADGEATTYYYGDEITVVAYPESGVKFKGWSNGSTDQVLDLVLTGDLTLTASFSGIPTGIEDIESAAIYTGKGFIMVKNVANAKVTVVSISGRLQAQQEVSGDTRIDVPQGIYVVVLESGSDVKRVKVIVK